MNIHPVPPVFPVSPIHGCACGCACCRESARQKRLQEIERQIDLLKRERENLQRANPPVVFPLPAPPIGWPTYPVQPPPSPFGPFLSVEDVVKQVK